MCAQIDVRNSTAGKTPAFFYFGQVKFTTQKAVRQILQNGKRKTGNEIWERDKNNE